MEEEDYPQTFNEFINRFKSEEDCVDYIAKLRWPNGFVCPNCQSSKAWDTKRRLKHCSICGHQTSITAGTVFQNTRKPLRLWFYVMWWVVSQKTGASAKNMKDVMGFGSYKTAWAWLQKLRRIMVCPGRNLLKGNVEVDETYIGGEEEGTKGRKMVKKALVAVAVELVSSKKLGRVRFRYIQDASSDSLVPFVKDNIEKGSIVTTDGWKGYSTLGKIGYHHEIKTIAGSGKKSTDLLPNVHLVVSSNSR